MKIKLALGVIAALLHPIMSLNPWSEDRSYDPEPFAVASCEDTHDGFGPCVMFDEDMWWYVPANKSYPEGATEIGRCDDPEGGYDRSPCVWITEDSLTMFNVHS